MKQTIKGLENIIEQIKNLPYPIGDSGVYANEAVQKIEETIERVKISMYFPLLEEEYFLAQNNVTFIEAVKKYRERTGSGLLEAKNACEKTRGKNK